MRNGGQMTCAEVELEHPIRLSEVEGLLDRPVTRQTIHNWRLQGLRVPGKDGRIYLGWFRRGRIFTTIEAVQRFKLATNGEAIPVKSTESQNGTAE